jgi:hypothetical protein
MRWALRGAILRANWQSHYLVLLNKHMNLKRISVFTKRKREIDRMMNAWLAKMAGACASFVSVLFFYTTFAGPLDPRPRKNLFGAMASIFLLPPSNTHTVVA